MEIVTSVNEYVRRPLGRCLLGESYCVWWHSVELNGLCLWDRPDEEHVRCICRALEAEIEPGLRHASVIDARRVRAVDLGAFNALCQYVRNNDAIIARTVRRQAVLRSEGLPGVIVAGFYAVFPPSYEVSVFTEDEAAIRWLGVPAAGSVLRELDAFVSTTSAHSPLVLALRAHLKARLGATNITAAARALHVSTRQLQRRLCEAATTFRREQDAVRLGVAEALLLETNYDVKRVAIEVGYRSQAHFTALFRKRAGNTPSEWRARLRERSGDKR